MVVAIRTFVRRGTRFAIASEEPNQIMSYMQISQKFYDAFKLCGSSLKSPPIARKLHAQLILSGLDASIFLLNNLLPHVLQLWLDRRLLFRFSARPIIAITSLGTQ
ncbi:hypothetical protein SESBI_28818 [Sesbania bispinosa]|nr:hypothetical protein SESBI_28818 [Sesbania bispinosa]